MKIEIHHHHHSNAEDVLSHFKKWQLSVEAKLDRIWEKLKIMSEKEQQSVAELSEQLTAIQNEQAASKERGQKQIGRLTNLVQTLQAENEANADVDLSGVIAQAKTILQNEKESFSADPSTSPANEAELPEVSGANTTGEPFTVESGSGDAASEVATSNQPFEPSPSPDAETKTAEWDDQERTPVPRPNE